MAGSITPRDDGTLLLADTQLGFNDAGADPLFMADFAPLFDAGDTTFYFDKLDVPPAVSTCQKHCTLDSVEIMGVATE
jgi:hypothetical protein